MGLMVYSLENIPKEAERDYYVYLLDYGWDWDNPISKILNDNFEKMSKFSANNSAVTIKGVGEHFTNEVFSWHGISGIDDENILPAILITNKNPNYFKEHNHSLQHNKLYQEDITSNLKLILIPFKKYCKNDSDVIRLVDNLFKNIQDKQDLSNFSILKQIKNRNNLYDAIILQPNFTGIGLDIKKLLDNFKD